MPEAEWELCLQVLFEFTSYGLSPSGHRNRQERIESSPSSNLQSQPALMYYKVSNAPGMEYRSNKYLIKDWKSSGKITARWIVCYDSMNLSNDNKRVSN